MIITNSQGKLINAGYAILKNVPPNTPYPFEVDLVTLEKGNIKIVAYPISLGEDIPTSS